MNDDIDDFVIVDKLQEEKQEGYDYKKILTAVKIFMRLYPLVITYRQNNTEMLYIQILLKLLEI